MNDPLVTLLDSAHGTRLIARGLDLKNDDPALWVLKHPEVIRELHLADLDAGSQVLTTCTFGASRDWLSRFGRFDVAAINRKAVEIAREAIRDRGGHAEIAGCVGPASLSSESDFREQLDALLEARVDRVVFETLAADQIDLVCRRIPGNLGRPAFATLWNWGDDPASVAIRLRDSGLFAGWGINCMSDQPQAVRTLCLLSDAGLPASILKPSIISVEEFVDFTIESLALGVRSIGGCCGTDHRHIAASKAALEALGVLADPT
jgi:methionine synthase I (cobalamin-dependent)